MNVASMGVGRLKIIIKIHYFTFRNIFLFGNERMVNSVKDCAGTTDSTLVSCVLHCDRTHVLNDSVRPAS